MEIEYGSSISERSIRERCESSRRSDVANTSSQMLGGVGLVGFGGVGLVGFGGVGVGFGLVGFEFVGFEFVGFGLVGFGHLKRGPLQQALYHCVAGCQGSLVAGVKRSATASAPMRPVAASVRCERWPTPECRTACSSAPCGSITATRW